jgi:hypothetical protein
MDAISRNASTLTTLHFLESSEFGYLSGYLGKLPGDDSDAPVPPKWEQVCPAMVNRLVQLKKLQTLRLLVDDTDLEQCSDQDDLIQRFWSLFPSLEYLFVTYISDKNLARVEESCTELHSLSLRPGHRAAARFRTVPEVKGPVLAQFFQLRKRLRFLNLDAVDPLPESRAKFATNQRFEEWEQAIIDKAPPNVGINLFYDRYPTITGHGRAVFPALATYIKHGLDLSKHCTEVFCSSYSCWHLICDPRSKSRADDEIIQNLHHIFDAIGSDHLLYHPVQWHAPLVHSILLGNRVSLLRRFLVEFIAPMNSTMRFYALSPRVPLITARKVPAEMMAYLSDSSGIQQLASDLNIAPNTQEFVHFKKYIVGSLCSVPGIQALEAFSGTFRDVFLNHYAHSIISDEELLFTRDSEGLSLLHAACSAGRLDLIERILASPKAREELLNEINDVSCSPLHSAMQAHQFTAAKALLDAGADVTLMYEDEYGYAVFMTAINLAYSLEEYDDRFLDEWSDDFFEVVSRIFQANPREDKIRAVRINNNDIEQPLMR